MSLSKQFELPLKKPRTSLWILLLSLFVSLVLIQPSWALSSTFNRNTGVLTIDDKLTDFSTEGSDLQALLMELAKEENNSIFNYKSADVCASLKEIIITENAAPNAASGLNFDSIRFILCDWIDIYEVTFDSLKSLDMSAAHVGASNYGDWSEYEEYVLGEYELPLVSAYLTSDTDFSKMPALRHLGLPKGVKHIGASLIDQLGCKIETITLPESAERVDEGAFSQDYIQDYTLKSVTFKSHLPSGMGKIFGAFATKWPPEMTEEDDEKLKVRVPKEDVAAFQNWLAGIDPGFSYPKFVEIVAVDGGETPPDTTSPDITSPDTTPPDTTLPSPGSGRCGAGFGAFGTIAALAGLALIRKRGK
jgi:hypothetical protein